MPFRKRCKPEKFALARKMRLRPTAAEGMLWEALRKRPHGLKFRRQEVILGWIADFYCHKKKLLIEIDGGYHQTVEQQARDRHRDAIMREHGLQTIRFSNEEVTDYLEVVLETIYWTWPPKRKAA